MAQFFTEHAFHAAQNFRGVFRKLVGIVVKRITCLARLKIKGEQHAYCEKRNP